MNNDIATDGTVLFPTKEPIEGGNVPGKNEFHGMRGKLIYSDDVINPGRSPWISIPRHGYPSAEEYTEFEVFFYNSYTKYTFRAIVPLEEGILLPPPRQYGAGGKTEALYWRPLDSDPSEEQIKEDEQALINAPKEINLK